MAVLSIDTMGCLSLTSKGNKRAETTMCLHTLYVFAVPIKEKSAENVILVYLSGILAQKDGNVAILSDNVTELKKKAVNEACDQLGIKGLFSNPFHPKVIQE